MKSSMTRGGRGTRTLVADRPLDCLTDSVQYPLATPSKRLPVNGILVRTIQSDETQFAICVIAFPNWNRDFAKSCTPPDRRSEERRVGKECRSGWWPQSGI